MSRFDYVKYDEYSQKLQSDIKDLFTEIDIMLMKDNPLPECREKYQALVHLEMAYMWIGKLIREDQISRNGKAELQEERNNE